MTNQEQKISAILKAASLHVFNEIGLHPEFISDPKNEGFFISKEKYPIPTKDLGLFGKNLEFFTVKITIGHDQSLEQIWIEYDQSWKYLEGGENGYNRTYNFKVSYNYYNSQSLVARLFVNF